METERSDTEDPQCVDQQHLSKKVVNGDAIAILNKTHARLNGECADAKNSGEGSPLVNGSDDAMAGAKNGGNESESEGQKQTNGKTDSDNKDLYGERNNFGEQKVHGVDLVAESSSACILLDDSERVNDGGVTADDADKKKVASTDSAVQMVEAATVNGGSTNLDNCVSDTSIKDIESDCIDSTRVTELVDDDSCNATNLDEGNSSRDATNLTDGGSSRGVTNLDDGDSSRDVTNLADGDSSKDVATIHDGDSSKDATNIDDGDSSKDVTNIDDDDSRKDVTNLDDGDSSRDVTNLTDGDSSKDVTNIDDGDSSKNVTNIDDGDSSKDVTNIDDGDSSKGVTNFDDCDNSKGVTNLDDDDSSKDVINLHKGDSSRKFAELDKGSGDSKGSRKFKKLDKGNGISGSSRADSKLDDDNCRDIPKYSEISTGKSTDKVSSCDIVNLDDDDDDSNIADIAKTVAVSGKKDGKEAVLRTQAAKSNNIVVTDMKPMETNKGEARKSSQKTPVATSSSMIVVKDITPVRSASSATTLPVKPSQLNQGPQSLAAKGHLASMQLRPMSNLLYDLGLNLTKEQVYKDLIRIQTRKRSKNRLTDKEIQQLNKLKDAHKNLSKKNTRFHFPTISCHHCAFKTNCLNAMAYHDEFVETDDAGNTLCGLCDFKLHSTTQNDASKGILNHIRQVHKRQPRIYTEMQPFTCAMCLFETNLKVVLNKHIRKCERNFKLARNLEPGPADCDIPMKLPRYGAPTLTETLSRRPTNQTPHASGTVGEHLRKRRENVTIHPPYQHGAFRGVSQGRPARPSVSATSMQSLLSSTTAPLGSVPQQLVQVGGRLYNLISQNGQTLLTPITASQLPVMSTLPRQITPQQPRLPGVLNATQPPALGLPSRSSSAHALTGNRSMSGKTPFSPEPVITVVEKNSVVAPAKTRSSTSPRVVPDFEICEICGGFVKDRDSLRIHFYYAHKVEIQRDVFLNKKGQLLCDLCAKHFWTYQGLVKHRQVEHKFMKEDDFRCFLCVKSGITDMLRHLSSCHGITRETLFRRTVCPCCGQHFVSPKSLEGHMRLVHAGMFRQQELQSTALASHLHENAPHSEKASTVPTCLKCNVLFETTAAFLKHCEQLHTYKCSRCQQKWSSLEFLQKHFKSVHGSQKEACLLCGESVVIGRPFIHHMKRKHLRSVSVSVTRLSEEKYNFSTGKRCKLSKDL